MPFLQHNLLPFLSKLYRLNLPLSVIDQSFADAAKEGKLFAARKGVETAFSVGRQAEINERPTTLFADPIACDAEITTVGLF